MTDAELLQNPELLLRWSASLDYRRLSFDRWLEAATSPEGDQFVDRQTEGEPDESGGAEFSVHVRHMPGRRLRLLP